MSRKVLNATFGLAGILGKPFGSSKKKPVAPAPGPIVMPLPDDEQVRRAKRAAIVRQRGGAGRASTLLTPDSDTLGGY